MARATKTISTRRPMRGLAYAILIALGVGVVLLQTAPSIKQAFTPVRTAASDQLVGGGEANWFADFTGQTARNARITELEAEVRDLARWRAAAISMAQRLESYETILNLQGEPPVQGVTARIIAESDGPFADTLLANAGKTQGIEPGFVAINEGGLVGRVIQLGQRSSRILVVTDFNSRVPVMGELSGVRAIMYGGRDGIGALEDLPEADQFSAGERILTTGEGGVFPRGVVAGFAQKRGNDWRVTYAMKRGEAGFVRLVPPARIPTPEDDPVTETEDSANISDVGVASETAGAARLAGQ